MFVGFSWILYVISSFESNNWNYLLRETLLSSLTINNGKFEKKLLMYKGYIKWVEVLYLELILITNLILCEDSISMRKLNKILFNSSNKSNNILFITLYMYS